MSLQKSRPIDTLQRIISSFKHFEKKLDKLQEDVNYHGHTLTELRVMVANLSSEPGPMMSPETNIDSFKRSVNNTAIQYDERFHKGEPNQVKRKKVIQPFTSKTAAKSFQNQQYGIKPTREISYQVNKTPSSPKKTGKQFTRHRKAEAPRKVTSLRIQNQKATEKKM